MNKKLIVPIVLCIVLVILILSQCLGSSNKIKIISHPIPTQDISKDSIELKVYVENSGSMDAYMCAGSNLKDAVFDYISDLNRYSTSCSLNYINTKVIPYKGDLRSFIKDLTPASFAKAGGDRSNTNLMQILDTIIKANDSKTVSVFVSDCILDIPQNAINYLGQCQVSIKNTFNEAISANPMLGVEIMKLESKFDGYWFCGKNKALLHDVKRPYYIWVIGDQRYLAHFNKLVPVNEIIGGIKEYCAYATPQTIPFEIKKETYVVNHTGKINVDISLNLRNTLQSDEILLSNRQYKTEKPSQVKVVSISKISDAHNPYSHLIEIEMDNPATIKSETLTFSYPKLATWIQQTDDSTGANITGNIDRTTGLMSLIRGVSEAFKQSTEYGTVSFTLTNR